ncbi:AAA family ATPase, partial [Staphylococcus aureus]|uniref:AAA family ATPase n=1 Tax=Staphylococcus aureus TaxID=1280 RepID=UPI001CF56B42
MDFKTLEINNYQSIGHIEYNLSNQGVVLVVGKNLDTGGNNGAGKSSFLGAIAYALYGKNAEGHSSNDVVNNKVGKDTSVILTFDKEDHSYKIARYRKDKKYKN